MIVRPAFQYPIARPEPLSLRAIDELDKVSLPQVEFVSETACDVKDSSGAVLARLQVEHDNTFNGWTDAITVQTNRFMLNPA